LAAVLALILGGCASLVEKGGALLDGSAFREKELSRWEESPLSRRGGFPLGKAEPRGFTLRDLRGRGGEGFLEIGAGEFPFLRIRAGLPPEAASPGPAPAEGWSCYLDTLEFLSPHEEGWSEFTLELSGALILGSEGMRRSLRTEGLETLGLSRGKFRYKDRRRSGEEALGSLRNRYERISALAAWMRERSPPGEVLGLKEFGARWKGELLPELLPPGKRPPAFALAGEEWAGAEGLRWNAAYTRSLLPEELRPLRDSGALLRDWEEALPWIRLFYYWDYLAGRLSSGVLLEKITG
jgi:hypothetical protein